MREKTLDLGLESRHKWAVGATHFAPFPTLIHGDPPMSDKTTLDETTLDLKLDSVTTIDVDESLITAYLDGGMDVTEINDFDSSLEAARDYANLEGKDSYVVLRIKAGA